MKKEINIIEKTRNAFMKTRNFWYINRVAKNDLEADITNRHIVQCMMNMPEFEVSNYKDQYGYDFWIVKNNKDNSEVIYHDRYREVEVR